MAQINNSQLSKELIDGAKIQISAEQIPTQLADKVVPVMEVNPKLLRNINIISARTSGGNFLTTPTDRDFYFYGSHIDGAISIASTNCAATISIVPEGQGAVNVNAISTRTLITRDSGEAVSNLFLPSPIKLARGSVIAFSASGYTIANALIFASQDI